MGNGNYPNMSYCAFENTSRAIDQLIGMCEEARSYRDLDLNRHEQEAWQDLIGKMETLTAAMERLEETRWDEEDIDEIGSAANPMRQADLASLDNTALRQVRDMACTALDNADLEPEDAEYFEMLAGAADDLLAERRN